MTTQQYDNTESILNAIQRKVIIRKPTCLLAYSCKKQDVKLKLESNVIRIAQHMGLSVLLIKLKRTLI